MVLLDTFRSCWLIATFGIILYVFGTSILIWNEGRAVHTIISLGEAKEYAVTVDPNKELENNYNGRIIHMSGPIVIGEPLTEPDYSIQVLSVKLKRRVQMYQWVEDSVEREYGGSVDSVQIDTRSYYYTMEWKDKLIDSRSFHIPFGHKNPTHFPIESMTQVADAVYIGHYEMGTVVKDKFNNYLELTSDARPEDISIKLHLGLYYHTNDVFNPEIGDIRIQFSVAGFEGEMYTIVGMLENNKIVPYVSKHGLKVLLVYSGEQTISEVFKQEHQAERLTTWGFRLMGWVFVFFGVTCTSKLLHILFTRVEILSVLAPDLHYPVGGNILLSLSFALIIAAISWIVHRPMVGAGLLFAAASPFVWCARNVAQYNRSI